MVAVIGWIVFKWSGWLPTSRATHLVVSFVDILPLKTTPDRVALHFLGFSMLAHPENFLIRYFIEKEDDTFLCEAVVGAKIETLSRLDLGSGEGITKWIVPGLHQDEDVPFADILCFHAKGRAPLSTKIRIDLLFRRLGHIIDFDPASYFG